MTQTQFAFIKAQWHAEVVDQALLGFLELVPASQVDVFDVPGAFELPLVARDLAATGRYGAVAAAALVVDGLMRAGLDTGVPVLSVSLTPHNYQETEHHRGIFAAHFREKGREAARAALAVTALRSRLQPADRLAAAE